MKSQKILHILKSNSYSGAENVVITIIDAMRNRPDYQHIQHVYLSPQGRIGEDLAERQITYEPVDKLTPRVLRQAVKRLRPDIIHAHDFTAGVVSAFAFTGVPIISHLHSNPPWLSKWGFYSVIFGISSLLYRKILVVSPCVAEEYVFRGLIRKKTEVVYNPIDIALIQQKSKLPTAYLGQYDLVFLGRLAQPKNPLGFIRIVSRIAHSQVRAVLIGDGELRQDCIDLVHRLNLSGLIDFTGFVSNPYPILAKAKALCMPSHWEGFGLAAVEALALGVPVVAAPVGGLSAMIDDRCGRLCHSEDEFADEILQLLTDSSYHKRKSRAALRQAEKLHNIEPYIRRLADLYEQLL